MVFQAFNSSDIELYVEGGIDTDQKDIIKKNHHGGNICILDDGKKRIKDHKIELFPFLYSEFYNPCLGHQVAIDANGDIKCCLWFNEVLGNVEKDDLKELIIRGDFDNYWETHKMKIEGCKDCELRRVCNDCRAEMVNTGMDFFSKPSFCDYDPYGSI